MTNSGLVSGGMVNYPTAARVSLALPIRRILLIAILVGILLLMVSFFVLVEALLFVGLGLFAVAMLAFVLLE